MRECDHIARWGGEEFIILCPQTSQENAFRIANNLRESIAKTTFTNELKISCSFGVTQFISNRENSIQAMLEIADAAMYTAKKSGRNRVEIGTLE